jgi:hypothetical protein
MPIIMGSEFEQAQEANRVGAEDRDDLETISRAPDTRAEYALPVPWTAAHLRYLLALANMEGDLHTVWSFMADVARRRWSREAIADLLSCQHEPVPPAFAQDVIDACVNKLSA